MSCTHAALHAHVRLASTAYVSLLALLFRRVALPSVSIAREDGAPCEGLRHAVGQHEARATARDGVFGRTFWLARACVAFVALRVRHVDDDRASTHQQQQQRLERLNCFRVALALTASVALPLADEFYYRKADVFNMSWDVNLSSFVGVGAKFGGPLAISRGAVPGKRGAACVCVCVFVCLFAAFW